MHIHLDGRTALMAGIAATALAAAMPVQAAASGQSQEPATAKQARPSQPPLIAWNLPAQPLGEALLAIGRATGLEIVFASEDVAGRSAPALNARLGADAAIARLIAGTGLVAEREGDTIVVRRPANGTASGDDIVVTGSRIRGAPPASPVIRLTSEDIRNAGQSDLGQTLRAIPQNFNGGQNPGVGGGVRGADNVNVNSGSSPNLRGLGPDATLTLLNGKRMAYGGVSNAIDISAIPVDAVDRVEVVADGASALYGSDAIAGVVNILLKRDYEGVSANARFGAATDGGDVEQQYGLLGGAKWSSGGFMAAVDRSHSSAILARNRSYTANQEDTATLYPEMRSTSALASLHQSLGGGVTVSTDLLYNERTHVIQAPFSATAPYDFYGTISRARSERFSIAPQLNAKIGGWAVSAGLVRAEDKAHLSTIYATGGVDQYDTRICMCNSLTSIDLAADGKLFDLAAGGVRLALGGGYRENRFDQKRRRISFVGAATTVSDFSAAQESWYGYGELFMPLVSPDMAIPMLDRLSLSAALRYENYRAMGEVATPKLGVIATISPDLKLSANWGKSFKAPTLYQQFLSQDTALLNVAGAPAGSTMLYLSGGNPDLVPERSTSWTATASLTPRALPGFTLELSYFDIAYSKRVVTPIASTTGILSNPLYAAFVTLAPSLAQQQAAIALSGLGLNNLTSNAYDPARVLGIVDNRYTNVARQKARGADISARYRAELDDDAALTLQASASYIESERQLFDGQPFLQVAGTIFNSPHWRLRSGAVYEQGGLSVAAWLGHIGKVTDDRTATHVQVAGQTSLDLTVRYRTHEGTGATDNMEFALSVQNLLNDKPATIRTDRVQFVPYDSTNYSAIGRFVGFSITKRWQ
ncbi:TonB-dependent receptor domain-containing protein [Sphingomonas colocasiae]|uniref:TonB-dependent receptor n=1 Tax=Sphingomonas colocasiae TaxID=1848973 RepID=A0ABS7PYK6_9SPHN|nr:TonB-dependent receptor [Sphingomonas colocasiae]MBY8823317.1 TonB-dependent receptor [Sphingomonas colocasiae]MBY8826452.1 TonB-dependent receptor [Sphingomonas colocasiae]